MTLDLLAHLGPQRLLVTGQTLGEPTALLEELFSARKELEGSRLLCGMSLTDVFTRAPAGLKIMTFVGLGTNGALVANRRMDVLGCHMSDLPRALEEGPLVPDVALVLLGPPNSKGMCSLGVSSDYVWHAVNSAQVVLAEINEQVPCIGGDTAVSFDRIDGFVRTDRPLPEQLRVAPSDVELRIADNVEGFVRNGTCLQIGVGRLGEAILNRVANRQRLGLHTGMIGEKLLEMIRDGVITNTEKGVDSGLAVAGSILGGSAAVRMAAEEPSLRLRSIAHTHSPGVISNLSDFLCVNSAIEVDLLGQVNSEVADGKLVGAIGGAVDYLRAAFGAPGGRSVVALPATAKRGTVSRIVPAVQRVTALRTDVDAVATEYGVAELRDVSEGERASRLIAIAAPEHRQQLKAAALAMGL